MTESATPIATYTERLFQVRREFALFKDRVEIQAFWLVGKRHQTIIRLSDLSVRTTEFFVRNRWAKRAIVVAALAASAAVVFGRPTDPEWVQRVSLLGWVVAAASVFVIAQTIRRVRFVRLLKPDGKPGIDIAQSGPDAARFEEFVSAVKRQVMSG